MAEDEKSKLEKLKESYAKIQERYGLPSFKAMNEDFHIEKISEHESELLVSEVRKFIGDKLANYMRFVENLLNPVNVPMFVFSLVKVLDAEDKKALEEMYKELMKIELRFIELDLAFNEEKEVAFIKESYPVWQDMKHKMVKITEKINRKWDEKPEEGSKGYFG